MIYQNPAYGHELNSLFLDIIYYGSQEQFVTEPTKKENILDLVFISLPIVSETSVVPEMSDHRAVSFGANCAAYLPQNVAEHDTIGEMQLGKI